MWESQVLLTDGQVVFLQVLRFSPTFDELSARYKWNILERAVKPKSKKKKNWPVTLTYISCSSDFYTFYVNIPLSLGCMIRKVSAEDIAIRGNGTGLEYMCPTRHFVYIFFNPVFQVSTAKNEINLFNNHILIEAPVTFALAGAMTPSAEFLLYFSLVVGSKFYVKVYKTLYYEDPLVDFIHIWPVGRYRSKVFISTNPNPWG